MGVTMRTAVALQRAREILADPRPATWLDQPGRATELLAILRGAITEVDRLSSRVEGLEDAWAEERTETTALRVNLTDASREVARLAEAAGNVLQLHRSSADNTCSSCRIPFPCHTARAFTTGRVTT